MVETFSDKVGYRVVVQMKKEALGKEVLLPRDPKWTQSEWFQYLRTKVIPRLGVGNP